MTARLLTILLLGATAWLNAQQLAHVQGELLVELTRTPNTTGQQAKASDVFKGYPELTGVTPIGGRSLPVYRVRFDHTQPAARDLRARLQAEPQVRFVQFNHLIELRRAPDDLRYPEQWTLRNVGQLDDAVVGADINVEAAWDVTTGGVTHNGDTIVVAVLDDGTDLDHEDLLPNLWRNYDEIPGNGLDDDGNGYVDDYFGYDTNSDDGDPDAGTADTHGTPVAGIIGARGDNGIGVTGVNWNVRLMTIRNGFESSEAEVLQAYGYVLDARREYDASGGARGAYVVATNASWGRDFGQADDSPIWCGLYDELGAVGIINLGAVANNDVDVDQVGDLPANCTSDYLIGVTNVRADNTKERLAAFGSTSVDLGAYGTDAFTTILGNGYGRFGGTSAATPHVAGAAALLYAAPCRAFGELLEADPAAAALVVRDVLLTTTRANSDLDARTVTGGVLDVGAAMAELMSRCEDCLAPTSFRVAAPAGSTTELTVSWNAIASLANLTLRYRPAGTATWTEVLNPASPYTLGGLQPCMALEFQLAGTCAPSPVQTEILTASTLGCCEIPEWDVIAQPNSFFLAEWSQLPAAALYQIRYRPVGETVWTTRSSQSDRLGLGGGIDPCVDYEFEFRTDCDTADTDFGDRMVVTSTGCGACLERTYCQPNGYDNSEDWIEEVDFAGLFRNRTGRGQRAYNKFGNLTETAVVRGGVYPVTVTPGSRNGTSREEVAIYADWDHNGFFSSGELVGEALSTGGEAVTIDVLVPTDATLRNTRLRVIQQFFRIQGNACSVTGTGEIEDYCIEVAEPIECGAPRNLSLSYDPDADVTRAKWSAGASVGGDYRLRYRPSGTAGAWQETDATGLSAELAGVDLCGSQDVQLASVCNLVPGPWSRVFRFTEACVSNRNDAIPATSWSVFPNPMGARTQVQWGNLKAVALDLHDLHGRRLQSHAPAGAESLELLTADLPGGIYVIRLRLADGRTAARRVVKP